MGVVDADDIGVRMRHAENDPVSVSLRGVVKYRIKDVEAAHRLYGSNSSNNGQVILQDRLGKLLHSYVARTFSEKPLSDYVGGSRPNLIPYFERDVSEAIEIMKLEILRNH